ncbi:MAG: 4Fe-4S binding protein [Planctomycetales bacterium]|nr:4Fe-4S binding protein [Planctomycetales bacterium]
MTGSSQQPARRSGGISRRDFFLGRLGFGGTNRAERAGGASSRPNRRGRLAPAPMRYPQNKQDVEAGNPVAPELSTAAPAVTTSGSNAMPDPAATAGAELRARSAARRRTIPVLRPPGAIEESLFLAGCTRCEDCIAACPHGAIVHAPLQLREAAGTPMIDADRQPCLMCADFPCIAACEPSVLTRRVPPVMGTARIVAQLCVAHHGQNCTRCLDDCPVDNAIQMQSGKPVVDEGTCTGCGVCRSVCPAPGNAILLMPVFVRPQPC